MTDTPPTEPAPEPAPAPAPPEPEKQDDDDERGPFRPNHDNVVGTDDDEDKPDA